MSTYAQARELAKRTGLKFETAKSTICRARARGWIVDDYRMAQRLAHGEQLTFAFDGETDKLLNETTRCS